MQLWLAVRYMWGIEIPTVAVCEGHVSPFKAFADSYFARYPVTVWKASRGLAGKTFSLGALVLTEIALQGAEVSLLGGSFEQSKLAHDYTIDMWEAEGAPRHLLKKDPSGHATSLHNGGKVRVLTASTKSARGRHPQRLRLDEADEMDKFVLTSALGQPMEKDGVETQTTISSTHHYPKKTFTYVLEQASEKSWPVYEWCYRETLEPYGWLTNGQMERTRDTVPVSMWNVEYELQEPSIEGRAIDTPSVERTFDPELGMYEGAVGEYLEFEEPIPGAAYATGADWAKDQDYTVITTFRMDVSPWQCVAFERLGRKPWPEMVQRFDDRLLRFPPHRDPVAQTVSAAHDGIGVGNVVDDLIQGEADSVILAGRARKDAFTEYIKAIEDDQLRYPRIRWAYDEHRYCTVGDLEGAGHPPDSFIAGTIAWGRRALITAPAVGPQGSRKEQSWKT